MDVARWQRFSKNEQLAAIGAEVFRASIWENKDRDKFLGALERALALADAAIDDRKWKGELAAILFLREEIGKHYSGLKKNVASLCAVI